MPEKEPNKQINRQKEKAEKLMGSPYLKKLEEKTIEERERRITNKERRNEKKNRTIKNN